MAWEWSHVPEAYANAQDNLAKLPRADIVVIWAEWHAHAAELLELRVDLAEDTAADLRFEADDIDNLAERMDLMSQALRLRYAIDDGKAALVIWRTMSAPESADLETVQRALATLPPADVWRDPHDMLAYDAALERARALSTDAMESDIWDRASGEPYGRTCDNGGYNAWLCPSGCHKVPFSRWGTVGTVSRATMRPADLIPAFCAELEHLTGGDSYQLIEEAGKLVMQGIEWDAESPEADEIDGILHELFDALDECAPPGCYFGAHPGDGSDYGFWVHEHDETNDDDELSPEDLERLQ